MPVHRPLYYSELTRHTPSEEEVGELVLSFDKIPTLRMLAMINTMLSFYSSEEIERAEYVQNFLFQNLVRQKLRGKFFELVRPESRRDLVFFHPQQLLGVMKRLLLDNREGMLDPNDDVEARYCLGDTCLMVNDLLSTQEQTQRLQQLSGIEDEEFVLDELFAQLIFSAELSNPADALHSLVRSHEYLRIFERRIGDFRFSNEQNLFERFTAITGLDLNRYLWMIFCICVVYEDESKNLETLIANPGKFNIGLGAIFSKTNIQEGELRLLFNQTATDTDNLRKEMSATKTKIPLKPEYDLTVFRKFPLFYLNEEKDVATSIDSTFLTEKVSAGIFHTVFNSLKTEKNNDWRRFTGFWGEVFEEYVNDRLRDVFPLSELMQRFYASPYFDNPPNRSEAQAFDGVIDYFDSLVVMEYKGTYLTREAKYSGHVYALLADLDKNIGKGVRQIARSLEMVFNLDERKRDTFSQLDKARTRTISQFGNEDVRRVKRVYPVIVVQDFALQIGFANYKLRRQFEREKTNRTINASVQLMPLSLLTVEDLEKAITYFNEVTFTEILDEYVSARHQPHETFINALVRLLNTRGISQRTNEWVLARRREINEVIRHELGLS